MSRLTVGTWNCRMGARRKLELLRGLGCDVLVVPECADLTGELGPEIAFEWKGRYARKGLGVLAFGDWRLERIRARDILPWVLPLRLTSPTGNDVGILLATWTVRNSREKWPSYAGQVAAAIDEWEAEFRSEPVILAGDLNCSAQGGSTKAHLENVVRLEELGVRSSYHQHRGVSHGAEAEMTLRWFGRGSREHTYHCDFVFLSEAIACRLEDVKVGAMSEWVESGHSDHAPVVARLRAHADA